MAIVVGVDGSAPSQEALRWAAAEARLRRSKLCAVRAWEYPFIPPTVDPFPGGPEPDEPSSVDLAELRAGHEARLAGLVAGVIGDADGIELDLRLLEGNPVEVLVEASKDAELLVLGSRGHGGFSGLLLGSVSQGCVHHGRCPVVIVRGRD